jgi:hypothetical protein
LTVTLTGKSFWKPHWSVPSKPTICEWLYFFLPAHPPGIGIPF